MAENASSPGNNTSDQAQIAAKLRAGMLEKGITPEQLSAYEANINAARNKQISGLNEMLARAYERANEEMEKQGIPFAFKPPQFEKPKGLIEGLAENMSKDPLARSAYLGNEKAYNEALAKKVGSLFGQMAKQAGEIGSTKPEKSPERLILGNLGRFLEEAAKQLEEGMKAGGKGESRPSPPPAGRNPEPPPVGPIPEFVPRSKGGSPHYKPSTMTVEQFNAAAPPPGMNPAAFEACATVQKNLAGFVQANKTPPAQLFGMSDSCSKDGYTPEVYGLPPVQKGPKSPDR